MPIVIFSLVQIIMTHPLCAMLTRNPERQEELIIQLLQKAICKLYEIQCRIHNKYVTKKEEKSLGFSFLKKVKTHH